MTRFAANDGTTGASCEQTCCQVSRRGIFRAALGAAAALSLPTWAAAQPAPTARRKLIDVHHHYYSKAFIDSYLESAPLPPFIRSWTPSRMIEEMDKNNVDKSILSISTVPQHWFKLKPEQTRPLVRTINESGAQLVQDHKDRHGFFAFVTCSDVEGSLSEIAYALDVLKADGIAMSTNFGDKWPGAAAFQPVFEELNRRRAIVYFHPASPYCCSGVVDGVPDTWVEYPHDTDRAIVSLLFGGAFARYRNISWVFSHSGGALPFLAHRIDWQSRSTKNLNEIAPDGVIQELQKLHYETANGASAPTLAALLKFVPISQVMYGSDFPFVSSQYNLANLRSSLDGARLEAIEHENAERLIPRLKS
jgi:predicted TIM-barrel fold metal-dependent hydrolase